MFGAGALTDQDVRSAAEGSREAFERVAAVLEPQVRLMVAARLSPTPGQFDTVDELTQEVLLGLSTGISRLESRTVEGLRAFLSGVVARKVADLLKRRGAGRALRPEFRSLDSTVTGLSHAQALWQLLSASGTSLASAVDRAELVGRLVRALGGLKREYREVITLAFFDQLSTAEIASRWGVSRGAVSMLLLRAVRVLRQQMTGSSGLERSHDLAT